MVEFETLGQRLRGLRAEAGLSQGKLAQAVGLSDSYVSYLESGNRRPSSAVLHRLAAYFDVDPVYLRHGIAPQRARQAHLDRRTATQRRVIRLIKRVFAECARSDIVSCETSTLTRNNQHVTTITLIRDPGDGLLDHDPDKHEPLMHASPMPADVH
ncbi:helix-turn-helix transcriptional regulator [Nonomuraea sp. NPDC049784]|uniref:helix-turn-helix domain-containing protein n=1 Tax=Nonomuraea sp. NPDC049784 TaxID=3154361 RepID=UPI0033E975AD